ncbi:hypothetical protein E2C01_077319 [Portunus trituberculatus]|uniref:Uncharacterized protein n=1 Tax=Portunus trituberculatus TaxID=210409 RepID=A0A5B7IR26_PORTR|nr:hypothetical protein [Portunus trituberculatus]
MKETTNSGWFRRVIECKPLGYTCTLAAGHTRGTRATPRLIGEMVLHARLKKLYDQAGQLNETNY